MPFVEIKKSGRFALSGTRVVALSEGDILELSQTEYDDIVATSWADPADDVPDPDNGGADLVADDPEPFGVETVAPTPDPDEDESGSDGDDGVDWELLAEIVTEGDKAALDDYAETFGVKLDKRKSIEKMIDDFRAAIEAE